MIKCPLCGWNNHESTQRCVSCGGDLESRPGLVQDEENANCYSFTPPRRILDKGVGVTGSGNDLVFKFSSSRLVVLLIFFKLILLATYPHAIAMLYRQDNTLFYVLVPLALLSALEIAGWIMFSRGGRKKKRGLVSLGLRFLYAFHAIAMAYCMLTMLILLYFAVMIAFSLNLGMPFEPAIGMISSGDTANIIVVAAILLLLMVVFLNICAKFFHHTNDVFLRNSVKLYPFTIVIAIVFCALTISGMVCAALVLCRGYLIEAVYESPILSFIVNILLMENWQFITSCIALVTIVSLISAVMIIGYIRSYKKLFVKQ